MLPHYAPFKVAEQFRVLDAIAPGRIDLGLGRAPGSDGRTAFALNPLANERPAHFPADVRDLMAWVTGSPLPEGHPFAAVRAYPAGDTSPEFWMLGSSDYGAQVAAHFGLPYAFAWFFSDGAGGAQALDIYRKLYKPSARHPEPHTALCVWALAAETEAEAQFHFSSRARFRLLRDRGIFSALEPPAVAAAYPYTEAEKARMDEFRRNAFVGTAAESCSASRAARVRAGDGRRHLGHRRGGAARELSPARRRCGSISARTSRRLTHPGNCPAGTSARPAAGLQRAGGLPQRADSGAGGLASGTGRLAPGVTS